MLFFSVASLFFLTMGSSVEINFFGKYRLNVSENRKQLIKCMLNNFNIVFLNTRNISVKITGNNEYSIETNKRYFYFKNSFFLVEKDPKIIDSSDELIFILVTPESIENAMKIYDLTSLKYSNKSLFIYYGAKDVRDVPENVDVRLFKCYGDGHYERIGKLSEANGKPVLINAIRAIGSSDTLMLEYALEEECSVTTEPKQEFSIEEGTNYSFTVAEEVTKIFIRPSTDINVKDSDGKDIDTNSFFCEKSFSVTSNKKVLIYVYTLILQDLVCSGLYFGINELDVRGSFFGDVYSLKEDICVWVVSEVPGKVGLYYTGVDASEIKIYEKNNITDDHVISNEGYSNYTSSSYVDFLCYKFNKVNPISSYGYIIVTFSTIDMFVLTGGSYEYYLVNNVTTFLIPPMFGFLISTFNDFNITDNYGVSYSKNNVGMYSSTNNIKLNIVTSSTGYFKFHTVANFSCDQLDIAESSNVSWLVSYSDTERNATYISSNTTLCSWLIPFGPVGYNIEVNVYTTDTLEIYEAKNLYGDPFFVSGNSSSDGQSEMQSIFSVFSISASSKPSEYNLVYIYGDSGVSQSDMGGQYIVNESGFIVPGKNNYKSIEDPARDVSSIVKSTTLIILCTFVLFIAVGILYMKFCKKYDEIGEFGQIVSDEMTTEPTIEEVSNAKPKDKMYDERVYNNPQLESDSDENTAHEVQEGDNPYVF